MSTINVVGTAPDWPAIRAAVAEGLITERRHPDRDPLRIYNYTAKAQYDRAWTQATLISRGLIAEDERVVARAFPKFFNLDEIGLDNLPLHEPFEVREKLDGSLGILYRIDGEPRISTRGSFESPQAAVGTDVLRERYLSRWEPDPTLTYLFEIICPESRVVVDYGDRRDLVLLDVLVTATGEQVSRAQWSDVPFEIAEHHGDSLDLAGLPERPNSEGYVVTFASGVRAKVKHAEYVRLHKILTGVSSRTVWEYLRDGRDLNELVELVPDEFHAWLRGEQESVQGAFDDLSKRASEAFKTKPDTDDRRTIAEQFKTFPAPLPSLLFGMLDGRDVSPLIWKHVEPERRVFSAAEAAAA